MEVSLFKRDFKKRKPTFKKRLAIMGEYAMGFLSTYKLNFLIYVLIFRNINILNHSSSPYSFLTRLHYFLEMTLNTWSFSSSEFC